MALDRTKATFGRDEKRYMTESNLQRERMRVVKRFATETAAEMRAEATRLRKDGGTLNQLEAAALQYAANELRTAYDVWVDEKKYEQ